MPVVLLVDDEEQVTEGLRLALWEEPIDIVTAGSGFEGLEILRSRPVDVVVSDQRMPEMTGAVFLTQVRAEFPEVERIILTGQASMEATIDAINDAHVFRFLTKPCPPAELMETINEALALKKARELSDRRSRSDRRGVDRALAAAFEAALASATMAYQPIFEAADLTVFGYEALVRVDNQTLPNAQELVRAASILGRRFDLDRKVRSLVADDLVRDTGTATVFVNLLPESLGDGLLLEPDDPMAPHAKRAVLEITERAPLEVIRDVEEKLDQLRAIGYRMALDDLGAGYAGLNSLATLQPEIVKFDRELISGIHLSTTRSKLVSAMVVVCQDLGALTLAEGIETDDELDHVRGLGCDLLQGYAIGEPMTSFGAADL
jgi:EAL domain-containing protein (putative c-di-GMP-specific phosphodiesterase class I)